MKYNSVQEYFYKFFNRLYALCLSPLLVLVVLYWLMLSGVIAGPFYGDASLKQILLVSFGVLVLSDWVISFILFAHGLKSIRKIQSLGVRLERYYSLTIVRFAIVLSGCGLLAIGFYLTESQLFSLAAIGNLLLVMVLWPTSKKICNDLQLRGDERTLILFKKDTLR